MPTVSQHDSVFLLRFSEPEDPADAPDNVFSFDFLDSLDVALDQIEASEGPAALVTTGAGKYYSNGLDLTVVNGDPEGMPAYVSRVQRLYARLIRLELPTVAAINGHAFAGGAMLTLCHDHRVMRTGRGFWNLPEVQLGMPFPAGMNSLITTRLGDFVAGTAMLTAKRYPAEEAAAAGIIHEATEADAVLDRAMTVAAELAPFRGPNYASIRAGLLADALPHLEEPITAL